MSEKPRMIETRIMFEPRLSWRLMLRPRMWKWMWLYPCGFFLKYRHCFIVEKLGEEYYLSSMKHNIVDHERTLKVSEHYLKTRCNFDYIAIPIDFKARHNVKYMRESSNCVDHVKKVLASSYINAIYVPKRIITPYQLFKYLKNYGNASCISSRSANE